MNKKTIFRIILLMVIGGIFGAVLAFGMLMLSESQFMGIFSQAEDFFNDNNLAIHIILILFLYLPAIYLFTRAKKKYNQMANASDDRIDDIEREADKLLHFALLINGVFLIFNFMLMGMTFDKARIDTLLVLALFMISILCASMFEIIAIRHIQKLDSRLKGEPTSFRFHKDFLESCDEAEKLKIYRSGYHAFQISKNASLGFIILTIIGNMTFDTGTFPIFVSCMLMLIQITSYNYYALKENRN